MLYSHNVSLAFGETPDGKSIFADFLNPAHLDFTAEEHFYAAKAHEERCNLIVRRSGTYDVKGNPELSNREMEAHQFHQKQQKLHYERSEELMQQRLD